MKTDPGLTEKILEGIPHTAPFKFIDAIYDASPDHFEGAYRIRPDEYFFEGHFPGNPIVPGVILIEIMAQIGLLAFALFLEQTNAIGEREGSTTANRQCFLTSSDVSFRRPCLPNDLVIVKSRKVSLRHGRLTCEIEAIRGEDEKLLSKGTFAGVIMDL